MKKWKKMGLGLLGGFFGLCVLLVGAWFLPFPIEGNWKFPKLMVSIGNDRDKDDCHSFFRFENGKIMLMSSVAEFPPRWLGTYQRKGWGKYEFKVSDFGEDAPLVTVHSSCLRMLRIEPNHSYWDSIIFRDPHILTCRKILNHPSNDWMNSVSRTRLRVTGPPEKRAFRTRLTEYTKEKLEAELERIFMPPLAIYTVSNEVPSSIIETLVENGMTYTVHTNQAWIVWEMRRTSPGWTPLTKRTFLYNYSLTIIPPREESHGMTGDTFYLMHEGPLSIHEVEEKIRARRWNWDCWEKDDIHLYVENGVLPEDVKQLFEPFDLEYTVLDERVLYRGKRKDPYAKKGGTP